MKLPTIQPFPFDCVLFGAYSDDIEANAALHKTAMAALIANGVTVFSQIAMLHDVAKAYNMPTEAEPYRDLSEAGVRASACAVFITPEKTGVSAGMRYELALCPLHNRPIILWYDGDTVEDIAEKIFAHSRKELEMPGLEIMPQPIPARTKFFRINDKILIDPSSVKQIVRKPYDRGGFVELILFLNADGSAAYPAMHFKSKKACDETWNRLAAWQ